MHRVFVIGIDCANLDLILRWKDELPNLRKAIETGVHGKLKSCIPPATSPAWNCLFTGKNPGKLGIYDFLVFPFTKEDGFRVVNYSYQDSRSLWDILSDYDKKVGVVNVPTTFPPRKLNGLMVSGGLLTPLYRDVDYTFPSELKNELDRVVDGYEILPFTDLTVQGKEEEYLQKFAQNIDKQVRGLKYLMQKFDWDFFTYAFFVTDSVQHYFWHYLDETHPRYDAEQARKYGNGIKHVYKLVDAAIGELLAEIPSETNILVVSDHGSGPLYGRFLVNEWLKEKGLLKIRNIEHGLSDILVKWLFSVKDFIYSRFNTRFIEFLISKIPRSLLSRFLFVEQWRKQGIDLIESIDWSRTKAYGLGGNGSIFINLKGRESEGIVDTKDYERVRGMITEMLHQLETPTGEKQRVKVFRREEIYSGKHLEAAPDLLFILDDYRYAQGITIGHDTIWAPPETSGGHSLYGTFIACGPDIRQSTESQNIEIYDITPTVLHMLGVPIPDDIDGKVLSKIFNPDSEPAKKPVTREDVSEKERLDSKIRQLKRLGRI